MKHFDVLVKDYTHQNHIHFLQTDLSKMPDSKWPTLAELNKMANGVVKMANEEMVAESGH